MSTFDNAVNKMLSFVIISGEKEVVLQLSEYDTVGQLKARIAEKLEIGESRQVIDCWYSKPEDDQTILSYCCHPGLQYLVVYDSSEVMKDNNIKESMMCDDVTMSANDEEDNPTDSAGETENMAAIEFIQYFCHNFDDRGLLFHICRLKDAINQSCFTTLESRKILILYLHNKNDKFASKFCKNLSNDNIKDRLNSRFFLLGWNVENEQYHEALIQALSNHNELSVLDNFIKTKTSAALIIVPVKDSIVLFSCLKGKVADKDFANALEKVEEYFTIENEIELDFSKEEHSDNDIGSTKYQQLMLDLLGDRDYDSFEFDEFDLLKEKIGYALYGPPQDEEGYDDKQNKKIKSLFEVIVKQNNIIAKWRDRIVIAFIYNCLEPLPSEKKKRAKKYEDYNPNTDLTPIPVFVIRKCKNSADPCRIFIDDSGRVYTSWKAYLTKNKLHECEMILPKNGRYQADGDGNVQLERHLSPACGIDTKILQGADIANTAAGLVSGGVMILAAIPAITVAPVAVVAAGATGIGVGLYSIGRSAYMLYDRNKHKESLSFANSEARGAYLNIVAGSLGFVGAGANMAVSQLAARGANIGQGASAAVNVINFANIGASGISVANSGFEVFDQWWNENQRPSMLSIVQLSSSILFFGHAVYNFKMAGTIIEESQAQILQDYQSSLRSNRHRKTFNKLMKETVRQNNGNVRRGQAEVIKSIRNLDNKDEVFAILTRSNKEMNKNGVRFSSSNGEIRLNGVPIDMGKFSKMEKNEVITFLSQLPTTPEPTPTEVGVMSNRLQVSFRSIQGVEVVGLAFNVVKIFGSTDQSIQEKIINAVGAVVSEVLIVSPGCFKELDEIFPNHAKYFRLFTMVNGYFQNLVNKAEELYQKWLITKDPSIEEPYFVKLSLDKARRAVEIFHYVSRVYFMGTNLTSAGLKELINYFFTWFAKQCCNYEESQERRQRRSAHSASPSRRVNCTDCGGVYYH